MNNITKPKDCFDHCKNHSYFTLKWGTHCRCIYDINKRLRSPRQRTKHPKRGATHMPADVPGHVYVLDGDVFKAYDCTKQSLFVQRAAHRLIPKTLVAGWVRDLKQRYSVFRID